MRRGGSAGSSTYDVNNEAGSSSDGMQIGRLRGAAVRTSQLTRKDGQGSTTLTTEADVEVNTMMNHMVSNSWDDVMGECKRHLFASLGNPDNRCDWRYWGGKTHGTHTVLNEGECEMDAEQEALIGHDLNRTTPKEFLQIPDSRRALVKEWLRLTKPGRSGHASMGLPNGYASKYKGLTGNFPTAAMRTKTPKTFNARLVPRGDLVSEGDVAFASAPTANRGSIRTVICLAPMFKFRIGNFDVAQAFLQSDSVAFGDKQIICASGYVVLPLANELIGNGKKRHMGEDYFRILGRKEWPAKGGGRADFATALLTLKPLYGGRDGPL